MELHQPQQVFRKNTATRWVMTRWFLCVYSCIFPLAVTQIICLPSDCSSLCPPACPSIPVYYTVIQIRCFFHTSSTFARSTLKEGEYESLLWPWTCPLLGSVVGSAAAIRDLEEHHWLVASFRAARAITRNSFPTYNKIHLHPDNAINPGSWPKPC